MHRSLSSVSIAVLLAALAGCAGTPSAPNALQLPLQTAWYEGRVVHYVTTDVSDAEVARAKGANFVPRLADLLRGAEGRPIPLERVYSFVNTVQPTVFPSVPRPVGPDSRDAAYTPLWRMVKVAWLPGRQPVELKSEEAILAAQERGNVSVTLTDIVLNCPVVGIGGEPYLRGASLQRDPAR